MVYEPMFAVEDNAVPSGPYQIAYDLMSAQDPDAHEMFEMLLKQRPDDGLVKFQLKRLEAGQNGDLIVFTEK